jgi:hypothetical protein
MRTLTSRLVVLVASVFYAAGCGPGETGPTDTGQPATTVCSPYNPNTGQPQQCAGTTVAPPTTTIPLTAPPTTTPPTTTPAPPPYPQTAEEAGAVFGVPNSLAQYRRIGQFGWSTNLSVTLKLYPGLCVDFDLNANPAQVLTGETVFVDKNAQMHRALMKSAGSIVGGATVYWSTCNRL